ncbi:phage minor tail protein L [Enterobacterales bacterium CwR94]|nr:phage minor tail protein L [Enterobacterales bacterium CwR94]
MSFTGDVQQLEAGGIVRLIEVDGTEYGMVEPLRFHCYNIPADGWASFASDGLPSIRWQGNEYDPHPYELKGLELSSEGAQPTPTLSVGNAFNYVTALCLQFKDLVKFKVRIRTTMVAYLDAANWVAGNPTANPTQEKVQLFYVNSAPTKNRAQVDFELCSPFDIQNLQLPSRQITPLCTWCMRGWYRTGTGCDYAGSNYFTKDGTPTDDPSKDVCGGTLPDCEARHGANNPLPYGGMPAANLQGK